MAFPKDPFCGAMVIMSVACPPGCTVKLAESGVSEKSDDVPVTAVSSNTVPKPKVVEVAEVPPVLVVP